MTFERSPEEGRSGALKQWGEQRTRVSAVMKAHHGPVDRGEEAPVAGAESQWVSYRHLSPTLAALFPSAVVSLGHRRSAAC